MASINDLLNNANKQYSNSAASTESSAAPQKNIITEQDIMLKIENIKGLKMPEVLKTSMLEEAKKELRLIREIAKKEIKLESKKENELLTAIDQIFEQKLKKFLENKIILSESEISETEIGIVIDGMVFKGKMNRVK